MLTQNRSGDWHASEILSVCLRLDVITRNQTRWRATQVKHEALNILQAADERWQNVTRYGPLSLLSGAHLMSTSACSVCIHTTMWKQWCCTGKHDSVGFRVAFIAKVKKSSMGGGLHVFFMHFKTKQINHLNLNLEFLKTTRKALLFEYLIQVYYLTHKCSILC